MRHRAHDDDQRAGAEHRRGYVGTLRPLGSQIKELEGELSFNLVTEGDFSERVRAVANEARKHTNMTVPAYRMLQFLCHVRGDALGL